MRERYRGRRIDWGRELERKGEDKGRVSIKEGEIYAVNHIVPCVLIGFGFFGLGHLDE